ncbi:MAG: hypothetical protein Q3968_06115 [Clostridiaceae bacterium]|nr:hypothetical protein [Clostridiaceae bacterium]
MFNKIKVNPQEIAELEKSFNSTRLEFLTDSNYDGYSDCSGLYCYRVVDYDLYEFVKKYTYYKPFVEKKQYIKTDEKTESLLNKLYPTSFSTNEICIVVDSFDQLPDTQSVREELNELALKSSIHLFIPIKKGIYFDYVNLNYIKVDIVNEYPGSADDAATYGVIGLTEIDKDRI